ncbi:hypothetical protein ACT3CE_14560 [Marinifilum sp. RC60d5]|uniref:hypothetical protein n=1 Tax=Marinifilum sp. RC60d5 TaxID=3458414 RepID=UPI004036C5E7
MKLRQYLVFIILCTASSVYAQKSYVWAPTEQTLEPRTDILVGEKVDLVVFNDSEYSTGSKLYCTNQDVSNSLINMLKRAYPLASMEVIPFEQYNGDETSNLICIMIGIAVYEANPGPFLSGVWNGNTAYFANVSDYRKENVVSKDKNITKVETLPNTYGTKTAKKCLNSCYHQANEELLEFIDESLGRNRSQANQVENSQAIEESDIYQKEKVTRDPWRSFMNNPKLAEKYPPIGIPQQLHRNLIQRMNSQSKLNVVQQNFPPSTVSAQQVVGRPPTDGWDIGMWLLKVDFANEDRGWRTKNGLFLRQNIITLWEIMGEEKMKYSQLRNRAYNSSKRIRTSVSKHRQVMFERSRASQEYGNYVSEMYSGDFVKAADHYNEYAYHKEEIKKMEESRKKLSQYHSDYEMDNYEMSYQFRLDNSVPFSSTELQVIRLISESGYVPQEVWSDFRGSLNSEQKQQLGIR